MKELSRIPDVLLVSTSVARVVGKVESLREFSLERFRLAVITRASR